MARLRGFPGRHPLASAAIVCAAVSALLLYHAWLLQQRAPRVLPPVVPGSLARPGSGPAAAAAPPAVPPSPPASAGPQLSTEDSAGAAPSSALPPDRAASREPAANNDTGLGRENPFEPVTRAAGGRSAGPDTSVQVDAAAAEIEAAIQQSEQGVGRANPFDPLIAASAPGGAQGSGARRALPLPPVPPLDPTGPLPAAAAAAGLRLMGFVSGPTELAVIEDGPRSYLAAPGELIRPGLRVTAVDAARQRVRLEWQGKPIELSVAIPTVP